MKTPDLFSPGTRLSEIPPDFRGISWCEFYNRQIAERGEKARAEWRGTHPGEDAPIMRQALHTKRDDYGRKSAGPRGSIATTSRREF